ncbi:hypothetical protein CAEBREN_18654 [Caenorhabditis brenneri]|uniref:Uncharacterized protein n=1 Tax=Caenorhabditis brenneri TaxID=135651 RepID=G0MFY6_CAEBE|nr:hypothetical protein CAEBREN_18654 [Caenorhabditis brenneri]
MIPYYPDNLQGSKQSRDFDVYFVSSKAVTLPTCRIRDTATGNQKFMKDNYGVK